MTTSTHWKTWGLVFLYLAGFRTAPAWDGEKSPSRGSPVQNQFGETDGGWLVADFDGDRILDLARGHAEDSCFRVDIRLSTQGGDTSVRRSNVGAGTNFFVYDIDQDDDQDLILANFTSPSFATVWLNDGRGHFDESKQLDGFTGVRKDPATVETENSQAEPVSVAQDDDSPFDKTSILQAAVALAIASLVSPSSKGFAIEVGSYNFSPRSPPLVPALPS